MLNISTYCYPKVILTILLEDALSAMGNASSSLFNEFSPREGYPSRNLLYDQYYP